ncbi:uncharacterized protein ACA1_138390 [Acanthamoeba castellanii str. Neff]|uniref:Uncharacterized protein n=1 Tax=Acanthamoeba castellanii (strain ATCC 30010 / Neff) TaxID=1257118 RepID=L8GZL7_ACACF|nr:uncharacterized protein ACA1_138390 [Acanthamoeba castellanii str. Neff]ELR18417.1 hypothetical protein ACA1_138390 [Acanthamoeba castellanii str. Neff]
MDTTFGRLELVLHERPPRAARRKAEHSRERAPPGAVVVEGCSLSIVAVCFSPFKDLLAVRSTAMLSVWVLKRSDATNDDFQARRLLSLPLPVPSSFKDYRMKWDGSAEGLLYLPSTEQISIVQVYEDDECVAIAADNNNNNNERRKATARVRRENINSCCNALKREQDARPLSAESESQVGDTRPDEVRKNESEGAGYRAEERKRKRKRRRSQPRGEEGSAAGNKGRRVVRVRGKRRRLCDDEDHNTSSKCVQQPLTVRVKVEPNDDEQEQAPKEEKLWVPINSFGFFESEESEFDSLPGSQLLDALDDTSGHERAKNDERANNDTAPSIPPVKLEPVKPEATSDVVAGGSHSTSKKTPAAPAGRLVVCRGGTPACQLFFECACGKHLLCSSCKPDNRSCADEETTSSQSPAKTSATTAVTTRAAEPQRERGAASQAEEGASQATLDNLLFLANGRIGGGGRGDRAVGDESEEESESVWHDAGGSPTQDSDVGAEEDNDAAFSQDPEEMKKRYAKFLESLLAMQEQQDILDHGGRDVVVDNHEAADPDSGNVSREPAWLKKRRQREELQKVLLADKECNKVQSHACCTALRPAIN